MKLAVSQGQSFQKMRGGWCGEVTVKLDTATGNFAIRNAESLLLPCSRLCQWLIILFNAVKLILPVPVAARSKA